MKSPIAMMRGRSVLDTVGLVAVLLLFIANAFHFNIYKTFSFYRELFGVFFILLSHWYLLTGTRILYESKLYINRTLFLMLIFPVILVVWSFIDFGVPLYGDYYLEGSTELLGSAGLNLYVLRNACLYLPMVFYLYLRGLNENEIRIISLVVILVAPFSIDAYLVNEDFASIAMLGKVAQMGGGVAYNTYVPYLTFPVICGFFLLFSRISVVFKIVVLLCVTVTSVFCFFSASRQSVLFLILSLGGFFYFSKNGGNSKGKWLNLLLVLVVGIAMFLYVTQDYELSTNLLNRFGSIEGFVSQDTEQRGELFVNGLSLLSPLNWLMGAGLTCVITSGPHNDYVRWTQRVGFPLMILGMMPFFMAFRASLRLVRSNTSDNTLFVFLSLAVGFTLYHSLFGYPREDAFQAVAVYLGIALWFGALREGLL
jgi:O-antigen ligase